MEVAYGVSKFKRLALGRMRMTIADFYSLRVSEFFQALIDWQEHQREQLKFYFDTTRLLATQTANANRGEHDPVIKPWEVWESPFVSIHEEASQGNENIAFIDEEVQREMDRKMELALKQING